MTYSSEAVLESHASDDSSSSSGCGSDHDEKAVELDEEGDDTTPTPVVTEADNGSVRWTNGPRVSSGNRKARTRLEPMHIDPRSCNGAKSKAGRDC